MRPLDKSEPDGMTEDINGRKFRIPDVVKEPKRKYLDIYFSFKNSFQVQCQSVDPHMFYRVPRIDDEEQCWAEQ